MTTTRLLGSLGLSLLLSPLAAGVGISTFDGSEDTRPWPVDLQAAGSFGRGVPGHFTQALTPDAVLLRGTTPVLLARPGEFLATKSFSLQANDLDTLVGAAPGGLDAIVFAGPDGVSLGWYDAATRSVATQLVSAAPGHAQYVRAGDLDGDGTPDFAVVEQDGITVTPYLADGAGGFAPGASITASAPCLSLEIVRWDADAAGEIALLTELGVELFDDDGSFETGFPAALPGGALCTLSEAGNPVERLLWITAAAPSTSQFMMTLSPAGVGDLINLGALDAFAAVATDYDLDGFDDVLLSHKYSHELLWLENQRSAASPTGASFSAYSSDMLTFNVGTSTSPAPENDAWPIVADFDGDGDDDVVFPSELSQELTVLRGETADESLRFALPSSVTFSIDAVTQLGVLQLSLEEPALVPMSANALEIEVWRRADLSGPMDSHSVEHLIVPLPASWPLDVDVPLPESAAEFSSLYYLQVRLVAQDSQGAVARSFPTTVLAYAATALNSTALALTDEVTDVSPIVVPDGGNNEGTAQNMMTVPEHPKGEVPAGSLVMF